MKIKKIKSEGQYIYPATIAAAVKDANFLKENDSPMTQGEINLYLNKRIQDFEDISDAGIIVQALNDTNDKYLLMKQEQDAILDQLGEMNNILDSILN